jgi:hypothetical protein
VDLDFSRYGETLFEVLFAGGRMAGGGNVISEGKKLDTSVSICSCSRPPDRSLVTCKNVSNELPVQWSTAN